MSGVLSSSIAGTTFVVIDIETTGVIARHDQIVELAAVVVAGDDEPTIVMNTLVDPGREMGGTHIHGLTEEDVAGAPTMAELREPLRAIIANRVVATHNAAFDMRFLRPTLEPGPLPHVCTMSLFSLLGLGTQPSLKTACFYACGVELEREHTALDDALAAARLLRALVKRLPSKGIRTFEHLVAADHRAYVESLKAGFSRPPALFLTDRAMRQKPRTGRPPEKASRLREYQSMVLDAVADLQITEAEARAVIAKRHELGIGDDEMRAIHARVMMAMMTRITEDRRIDDVEREHMRRLHTNLNALGWAPGG